MHSVFLQSERNTDDTGQMPGHTLDIGRRRRCSASCLV